MWTKKPPSKDTEYEKLKYPPKNSPNRQTHQKMQIGTIFQIATLIGLPDFHQQANKSITLLGISQDMPKLLKKGIP